jgi:hypothetical protein
VKFFYIQIEPLVRSEKFPCVSDRIFFVIVAKRKIAEHLEKGVVALGEADIFEVVVFAAGAHAFLRRRCPRVIPLFEAEENVLELVHPRIRKQQGSIPMRHQRRAAHSPVPLALKEAQESLADVVATPRLFHCARPGHFHVRAPAGTSASVLQDSMVRLSQTQQHPAMNAPSNGAPVVPLAD